MILPSVVEFYHELWEAKADKQLEGNTIGNELRFSPKFAFLVL